ncbi:MAG: LysE family transporter [Deltaproteobacteria bacterium]|jgi:threonine/homoserine/homoserine lactone efflux protein|nr:LysE family transporter [Deltaproteobacteria bacterium]
MLAFLTTGAILGLSAGFAPGSLLALVISETLQHDVKAGIKVALAPILTDLPIIILTLFILAKLSSFHFVLGIISITGACFICYLGIANLKTRGMDLRENPGTRQSLQKGFLANALSPHPYLFWLTVGGPTTIKAMDVGLFAAIGFILCFYLLLVGSKIFLAVLTNRSRNFLEGKAYVFTMRLLGTVLIILAILLLRDALQLLLVS